MYTIKKNTIINQNTKSTKSTINTVKDKKIKNY
jgi:hypothetical protein